MPYGGRRLLLSFNFRRKPIFCVIVLATVGTIGNEGLVDRAKDNGVHLLSRPGLQTKHEVVGDVRGAGLMIRAWNSSYQAWIVRPTWTLRRL
jgi:4-aminobutyrate aminotransferase-like enzyme